MLKNYFLDTDLFFSIPFEKNKMILAHIKALARFLFRNAIKKNLAQRCDNFVIHKA
jgi:hypothetical protein